MIATERNWKFVSVARSSLWKSLHVCRGFRGMHSSGGNATRSVQWNRNGIAELSTNVCSSYPIWHCASTLDLHQTDKKQKCRAALAHCILHSHRRFLPHTRTMVSDYQASRRGRSSPTRIDTCLTSPWCLDPLLGPLLHHNLISSLLF